MPNQYALTIPRGGLPPHLTFDEVRGLIDACEQVPSFCKYKVEKRNRLFLETLWQTGCRLGELVGGGMIKGGKGIGSYSGVRPCDLDPRLGLITIQVEKRQSPYWHKVAVEPTLITELIAYSYEAEISKQERIFPISKRLVQNMIKLAGKQAGIAQRVNPHILRHSHAIHLRKEGVHAFVMQKALGHASIASTLVYGQASDDDVTLAKRGIKWR